MRMRALLAMALAAVLFAIGHRSAAAQAPGVETVAEYPAGTFLENLDVLSDGRVVFTSYFAKTIELLDDWTEAKSEGSSVFDMPSAKR